MSHKSNDKKYVLFQLKRVDLYKERFKWIPTYYNRKGLIHIIALGELGIRDKIIKYLAPDMSATRCKYIWNDRDYIWSNSTSYIPIYYIGKIGKDGIKTVSINSLQSELDIEVKRIEKERKQRLKEIEARDKAETYVFRRGPVPNIRKNKYHIGDWYRIPQLGRTRRNAENVEYKEFIKASEKYKNLPVWDDRPRHIDKSWKTSCKVRKQWEKHIKKHADTIRHEKRVYDIEELDLILDSIAY